MCVRVAAGGGWETSSEGLGRASFERRAGAGGEFAEYFDPFTGEQPGSRPQSWTAAVTLDWSASDPGGEAS
jgi:hypothetical protein